MLRYKLDTESTFYKFLGHSGQVRGGRITKVQWREALKKETLSFNCPQMDLLFDKLDAN